MKKRILVSNPSKQYSVYTVKALEQAGFEVFFFTSIWNYQQSKTAALIRRIPFLQKQFNKKKSEELKDEQVITKWPGKLYKFLGRIVLYFDIELWSFIEDRIHDSVAKKIIVQLQPDLIVGYEKSCLKTFSVAKSLGIKTILDLSQLHPNYILQLRNKYKFIQKVTGSNKLFKKIAAHKIKEYDLADQIFCLSAFAAETLIQNQIPSDKIKVVNLGYNPQVFQPKLPIQQNTPLNVVFLGTIMYRKGIQDVLEVIKQSNSSNIQLTVIGPRGDASTLFEQHIDRLKIDYYPFLSHQEMVKILQHQDIMILPSYLDSWAVVVPEAMACGVPCIVSTATGACEMITNDIDGWIIEPGDIAAMKQILLAALENPDQLLQVKQAAVKKAAAYTWSRYNAQIQQHLKDYV